jgi:uncharacterized spore protein YtfJ
MTEQLQPSTFVADIAERVGLTSGVNAVFGRPVEKNGITVIPVARVRAGFGGGRGTRPGSEAGEGGGGGGISLPIGFIKVTGTDATFEKLSSPGSFGRLAAGVGFGIYLALRGVAAYSRAHSASKPWFRRFY